MAMPAAVMLVIAGLFDDWDGTSPALQSCTMITTEPNGLILPLHHRMPAILESATWDTWLNPKATNEELHGLLKPCPEGWLVFA